MKVPGRAWLEFRAGPDGSSTVIQQIAQFEPRGLAGLLYWYLLSPLHQLMFRGMLRRIAVAALRPEPLAEKRDAGRVSSVLATEGEMKQ